MTLSITQAETIIAGRDEVGLVELAAILERRLPGVRQMAYRGTLPVPFEQAYPGAQRTVKADDIRVYISGDAEAGQHRASRPTVKPGLSLLALPEIDLVIEKLDEDAALLRRLAKATPDPDAAALIRQAARLTARATQARQTRRLLEISAKAAA